MRITFMEEVESRCAFSRKMYCPACGSHCYKIHHQLQPKTSDAWWIECEDCGALGLESPSRAIAIERWKHAY